MLLIIAGIIVGRSSIKGFLTQKLSYLVVYVLIPSVVINAILDFSYKDDVFLEILSICAFIAISTLFSGLTMSKIFSLTDELKKQVLSSSALMNCGYIGIPIAKSLGDAQLLNLIIIFTVIYTPIIVILSRILFGGTVKGTVINVLFDPLILSFVASLVLVYMGFNNTKGGLLEYVMLLVEYLAWLAIPSMLILMGMNLSRISIKFNKLKVWLIVFSRYFGGACAILSLYFILDVDSWHEFFPLILVLSFLPIGIMPYIYATHFNNQAHELGEAIIITTVISLVFLPMIMLYLYK